MSDSSPIDHLPGPDKLDPTQSVQPGQGGSVPTEGKFGEHMKSGANQPENTNPSNKPTPMQAAQGQNVISSTPPTMQTIQSQMNSTSGRLGDVKKQLHTKGIKLKQSDKYLLRNKLGQANQHIRASAEHLGVKTGPQPDLKKTRNPLNKFLAMVSDGQHQLNSAATQLRNMDSSGHEMNAGQMMLIQVKLQKAQQELDYTSVLLGKATELIKTLLNVQI